MIDLDSLEAAVAEGEKKNFFVAPIVKELIAELRERRGENDELRAELKATQREREHFHDAWVTAVEHRWGRGASVCAVAYNMAETIEPGGPSAGEVAALTALAAAREET